MTGKQLISQMMSYRRVVLPAAGLHPWITKTSDNSIKIEPRLGIQSAPDSKTKVAPVRPNKASICGAVGSNRGDSLVVGMKFVAAGPVNDNLCLGIKSICCFHCGRKMSIWLAPFSGRCFIEDDDGLVKHTEVLPPGPAAALEGHVWIHLRKDGDVRFLRQFVNGDLEDTGVVASELFNRGIESYPNISVKLGELESAVDVSVEHSGKAFPCGMLLPKAEVDEMWTRWGTP
jgi:hypothetical protein